MPAGQWQIQWNVRAMGPRPAWVCGWMRRCGGFAARRSNGWASPVRRHSISMRRMLPWRSVQDTMQRKTRHDKTRQDMSPEGARQAPNSSNREDDGTPETINKTPRPSAIGMPTMHRQISLASFAEPAAQARYDNSTQRLKRHVQIMANVERE